MVVVLMGVAGVGKTHIGRLLAADLDWPFYDADDLHPPANIDKMARGLPLTDADRRPWLAALRGLIDTLLDSGNDAVLACSALKRAYRTFLSHEQGNVRFVYLKGDYDLILRRLARRDGHFMPAALLRSQYETLEEPPGVPAVDVAQEPAAIVRSIRQTLRL